MAFAGFTEAHTTSFVRCTKSSSFRRGCIVLPLLFSHVDWWIGCPTGYMDPRQLRLIDLLQCLQMPCVRRSL
jgi:hypothetical protein